MACYAITCDMESMLSRLSYSVLVLNDTDDVRSLLSVMMELCCGIKGRPYVGATVDEAVSGVGAAALATGSSITLYFLTGSSRGLSGLKAAGCSVT